MQEGGWSLGNLLLQLLDLRLQVVQSPALPHGLDFLWAAKGHACEAVACYRQKSWLMHQATSGPPTALGWWTISGRCRTDTMRSVTASD